MSDYIRANFTIRRTLFLLIFLACFAVCLAVVLGKIDLNLWQTVLVLLTGLLAYEWAG
jgi:hypothetical protein